MYAPQPEICAYLQGVAEKYGVMRFVKLQHEVVACTWDAPTHRWLVDVRNLLSGVVFRDEADVLISARGFFTNPSWPEIPGFGRFEGQIMHSAAWESQYDFRDKKIGVVGNGSSAIQIVPKLEQTKGVGTAFVLREE